MQLLKKIALSVYQKPSLYLFIFLIIFTFDRYNRWAEFKNGNFPLVEDVDQFYSYLPAIFIHQDLTFSFPNNYWTATAKNGTKIARTTYGMALMYCPFFLLGTASRNRKGMKPMGIRCLTNGAYAWELSCIPFWAYGFAGKIY
jgi:hypothetical protein